jgi:DNA recombination protein RmuC
LATVIATIAALAALIAVLVALRGRPNSGSDAAVLRNDMDQLRQSTERAVQGINASVSTQLQTMTMSVQTGLAAVNTDVNNRLESISRNVTDRLKENATSVTASSQQVNERIANVQTTFATLQKQVGEMSEQARQIAEVSKSIGDLERVLSAPKLRGGFGELQLENLLSQVFASEQYDVQYRFNSGEIADAVLHLPQGKVAVDSKFSLENFRRTMDAQNDTDKKAARREFLKDVRKRIDEIATKYIRPAEGTLPFALMYIPAENVYYEAIIRDEDGNDLHAYCASKRVLPVSPNSLYAYLQTIVLGMNGMRVSQRAEAILREIQSLKIEMERFEEVYGKLGTHLKNAAGSYDAGERELRRLENRIIALDGSPGEQLTLIDEKKRALGAGS